MNKQMPISFVKRAILIFMLFSLLISCAAPTTLIPEEQANAIPAPAKEEELLPNIIKITVQSRDPGSEVSVVEFAVTAMPSLVGDKPAVADDAEPVIFSGMNYVYDQKCGHGDVVSLDGHTLRATPSFLLDNGNFLERLAFGTRVDIIDCRIWVDDDNISWLAVRTPTGKLGWVHIQSDTFYVTVYPIVSTPRATTGIPAGAMVAYVPPSECHDGPVSNEAIATSIGVDLIPVVGDIKGLGEVATGCDMVTGERLGNWRWLGLLGLIGLSEIALLRHGDEAADAARIANNLGGSLSYSNEAVLLAARNADSASDFARVLRQFDDYSDLGSDVVRHLDDSVTLSDEMVVALSKFEQPCSFSPETVVWTPGGVVPIAQIEQGDLVLAYDEQTSTVDYFPVNDTFVHEDVYILTLAIGQDTIVTTPEHPFYVNGVWIAAGNLRVGDLVTSAQGFPEPVEWIFTTYTPQAMYNLTVDTAHTYYVGFGGWLVHNACGRILRNNMKDYGQLPNWTDEFDWQAHHIIPVAYQDDAFVRRAIDAGWEFDGVGNGIALPYLDEVADQLSLPAHRGPHASYSSNVGGELRQLEAAAAAEDWSDARVLSEMDALVRRLVRYIKSSGGYRLP